MTPVPDVSVVIPTYNRVEPLQRSVASVLAQSHAAFEILVVDDASQVPVDPALLPADPRITILRHAQNRGVSAARNTGIAAAKGRYVAFLDSDDAWMPEKLARQLAAVRAARNPDCVFSMSQSLMIQPDGTQEIRPQAGLAPGERFDEFIYVRGSLAQPNSFMLSTSLARKIGFREELRQFEDHLFFIEAGGSGAEFIFVAEPLAIYNNAGGADRLSLAKSEADCEKLLRAAGNALSVKAALAFQTRYQARLFMEQEPSRAVGLCLRAVASGAMRGKFVASFCWHLAKSQWRRVTRRLLPAKA
jgi:glycosyltransferase involved in cell wall biosynthesis